MPYAMPGSLNNNRVGNPFGQLLAATAGAVEGYSLDHVTIAPLLQGQECPFVAWGREAQQDSREFPFFEWASGDRSEHRPQIPQEKP